MISAKLSDKGVNLLCLAVIRSAAKDYKTGNHSRRVEAEQFFKDEKLMCFSDICACLFGIYDFDAEQFLAYIEHSTIRGNWLFL